MQVNDERSRASISLDVYRIFLSDLESRVTSLIGIHLLQDIDIPTFKLLHSKNKSLIKIEKVLNIFSIFQLNHIGQISLILLFTVQRGKKIHYIRHKHLLSVKSNRKDESTMGRSFGLLQRPCSSRC